ncbi:hypothetical protein BH10ACT11_BH10ACT11_18230 [soil metagenome]
MALRCVYTDLDGTLLGPRGSLFRDANGNFSLNQARALEACDRANVEVVVMSGRRESTVLSDSRLMGQTSYIYEAGCAMVIDDEKTYLTGDWVPGDEGTPVERFIAAGIPDLLIGEFEGNLESHSPWHTGRELSLLMRGRADVARANELIAEAGHTDLRFLDNGVLSYRMTGLDGPTHAYHLVPGGASKAKAVDAHRRARGYELAQCIAIGDSLEDLETAASVGRFFAVANGPSGDEAIREGLPRFDNVTITEGSMGDGFYEAVVQTLVAGWSRRGAAAGPRARRSSESVSFGAIPAIPSRRTEPGTWSSRRRSATAEMISAATRSGEIASSALRQSGSRSRSWA